MNPVSSPGPLLFLGCKTRTTLHSFSQATFLDQINCVLVPNPEKSIHFPLFSSSKYFLNQEHYRALLKDSMTNILRPPSLKSFIITFRSILLPCHPTENHHGKNLNHTYPYSELAFLVLWDEVGVSDSIPLLNSENIKVMAERLFPLRSAA